MTDEFALDENRRQKPFILFVEDDVLVRETMSDALRDFGFTVIEAGSAAEAIDILTSGVYVDIMFTDLHMPGDLDGISLARWVSQNSPDVHVLIASGGGASLNLDLPVPIESYFIKPYSAIEIAKRIRELLGLPQ
jgi:CheY-like chemotaxis protein